jgi:5'-methylthioadenosine phosphorylase
MVAMKKLAVIGGSGLEKLSLFENPGEIEVPTPYGLPSSTLYTGTIGRCDVVILSRHGRDHSIPPSQVNNRANIDAIRQLGCTHIVASTACGSLREEIRRGDMVIPDQFIDWTRHRVSTFFEKFEPGVLGHVAMGDPFDHELRSAIIGIANRLALPYHGSGTVITIEGPRFSTRAESKMFRLWGADIVNMSVAPEASLAREAGIPYAAIALSTDYDSWKEDEKPVTWEEVLEVFHRYAGNLTALLKEMILTSFSE